MGKILVSNNSGWSERLREFFFNSGFNVNFENDKLVVYDKLNVHVENCVQIGDTVIASNGTFVYKNLIGREALIDLYSDYEQCGKKIKSIRANCFGSYLILIKENNSITAFVDEAGTYAMYYYSDKDSYLMTNTYYHIALVTGRDISRISNIEEFLEFCIIDNETPFKDVYRLLGDEVIRIHNQQLCVEKVCVNHNELRNTEFESAANQIKDEIIKYTEKMRLFSEKPVLFMTGGVDSRLSLATYLAASMKPVLCSWGGNYLKMNTKDADADVSNKIATEENLEFRYIDVSESDAYEVDEISVDRFDKYGEWATIYGNNNKWFALFENNEDFTYEFGYFGEIIKGWEILDSISKDSLTIDEFCKIYTGRQSYHFDSKSMFDMYEYKRTVHAKIKKISQKLGFDDSKLSREECMVLYYTYRLHADTKCCNFANMFGYCSPVLAHKSVADLINMCPYEYKQHDRINLYITKMIDSNLLNIEYFTHGKYMILDKQSLRLDYLESDSRKQKLIEISKKMHVHSLLKKVKSAAKSTNTDNAKMLRGYANRINSYQYFVDSGIVVNEKTFDYIPMAISMLCQCQMLDSVFKHKELAGKRE